MRSLAIFGGTFDPVHNGHVKVSLNIQSHFHFDSFYFVPCKIPTIKQASLATCQQRIRMLELALEPYKEFNIDLREIKRDTPSYMVETLQSFRRDNEDSSITLIIGFDAFLSLPKWHQWKHITKLSNLLVIDRLTFAKDEVPEEIQALLKGQQCEKKSQLLNSKAGKIMFFNAGDYDISSTNIRTALHQNKKVKNLLSKEVYQYIKESGLYR